MIFKKICFKLTAFEEIENEGKIKNIEPRDISVYLEKQEIVFNKESPRLDSNIIFDGLSTNNFKFSNDIDIKINSKSVQVIKSTIPINTTKNNVIVSFKS